jgi:hypothetical protein
MAVARLVHDGPHRHTRQRQVHDHLRQALVAVRRLATGAHQRNHEVAVVGVRGPDFLAVQQPARIALHRTGSHTRQVRTRAGFAHANAVKSLAPANGRQVALLLRFGAVLEQQGAALAVGDPMRADRRAKVQKLFHQHVTRKRASPCATISWRERDAQPTLAGQGSAEFGVVTHPRTCAHMGRHTAHGFGQKCPHLQAQRLILRRNGRRVQRIQLAHANTPFSNKVFMYSPVEAPLWPDAKRHSLCSTLFRCLAFPSNVGIALCDSDRGSKAAEHGHLWVMHGQAPGHLISLENPRIKRATGFSRQLPIVQKNVGHIPRVQLSLQQGI